MCDREDLGALLYSFKVAGTKGHENLDDLTVDDLYQLADSAIEKTAEAIFKDLEKEPFWLPFIGTSNIKKKWKGD